MATRTKTVKPKLKNAPQSEEASRVETLSQHLNHKALGSRGEDLALGFLQKQGYKLVEKNFRIRRGELDLIVNSPEGELVFVEVKSARSNQAGNPLEWVGLKKIKQVQRLAQYYCYSKKQLERSMRFDVMSVDFKENPPKIIHITNAFLPDGKDYF